jgi:hypothetical protein
MAITRLWLFDPHTEPLHFYATAGPAGLDGFSGRPASTPSRALEAQT